MFLFFVCFGKSGTDGVLHCDRNYSISGAGTLEQPFLAMPLPGFTYKYSGKQINHYSVFETRSMLNFSEAVGEINYNLHVDRQPINITKDDIAIYNSLRDKGAFIDFYIDGKKTSVALFPAKSHSTQMYYHFTVNIFENPYRCQNFMFQVVPTKIDTIESLANRNISFFFNFLPLIPAVKPQSLSSEMKYFYISLTAFIILILTIIYQIFRLRHNISIPQKEIWRLPKNTSRTIISVAIGIYIIAWFFFSFVGRTSTRAIADFFNQTFIVSFVVPVFISGILSQFIGVEVDIYRFFAFIMAGIYVPFHLITLIAGGSRGLSLFQTIVWIFVVSLTSLVVIAGTWNSGLIVRLKYTADMERGEIKEKQAPTPSWKYALDAGYIFAVSYASFPCLKYLIDATIHTQELSPIYIVSGILSVASVSGLFGIFTSSLYIRRHNLPWMGVIFGRGIAASVVVSAICLLYIFPQVSGFSSYLYFGYASYLAGVAIFGIGSAASFLSTFIVLSWSFSQQKIV